MKKILIAGGDRRMLTVAEMFERSGFDTALYGLGRDTKSFFEAVDGREILILPLPYSKDGANVFMPMSDRVLRLSEVDELCGGMQIFGGMLRGREGWHDYYATDEAKVLGAIPTAEGAISIAIENTDFCLWGVRVGVTGFGCVAKALSRRLVALGAKVTALARSASARAEAEDIGCEAFGFDAADKLKGCSIIFGTVPARVLTAENIRGCRLYIELASAPGGITRAECEAAGARYLPAPGLPGLIAPRTAGEIIFRCIISEVTK